MFGIISVLLFLAFTSGNPTQKRFNEGRIVGGEEVEPNSIPFQVSFQKTSGFLLCGGSIINKDTVITAAHCCEDFSPEDVRVVAGEHDLSETSVDEQTVGIQTIIMHELYGTKGNSYDICILKLEAPLKLNDKVKTITLPEKDEEFTGEAIVSGWGVRSFAGSTSPVLRAANITILSFDECKDTYGRQFDETMICAGSSGKDSCQGDSGGPLFQKGKLVGIVSWGVFCGHPRYPGVYGKVSKFHDWILAQN